VRASTSRCNTCSLNPPILPPTLMFVISILAQTYTFSFLTFAKNQIPLRHLVRTSFEPASNELRTSSEPASVMEFGFNCYVILSSSKFMALNIVHNVQMCRWETAYSLREKERRIYSPNTMSVAGCQRRLTSILLATVNIFSERGSDGMIPCVALRYWRSNDPFCSECVIVHCQWGRKRPSRR